MLVTCCFGWFGGLFSLALPVRVVVTSSSSLLFVVFVLSCQQSRIGDHQLVVVTPHLLSSGTSTHSRTHRMAHTNVHQASAPPRRHSRSSSSSPTNQLQKRFHRRSLHRLNQKQLTPRRQQRRPKTRTDDRATYVCERANERPRAREARSERASK